MKTLILFIILLLTCYFGFSQEYTYIWTPVSGTEWTNAANWHPDRDIVTTSDKLYFQGAGPWTATNIPYETIEHLVIQDNATVTFTSTGKNLYIKGNSDLADEDFSVEEGSSLTLGGASGLEIDLRSNVKALIKGKLTFDGGDTKKLVPSGGTVTFGSGSVFNATNFTGSPFGTSAGDANKVIFESGSKYYAYDGGHPFGGHNIVNFESGSQYIYKDNKAGLTFSNKKYSDFIFDCDDDDVNHTNTSGTSTVENLSFTHNKLTISSAVNFEVSGDITIASGAVFSYSPSSESTLTFNGTGNQAIGGTTNFNLDNVTLITENDVTAEVDIDLSSNSKLYINPGYEWEMVSGYDITNTVAANLLIKSDVNGTGSLIHNSPDVAGTMQKYILTNSAHIISSPFESCVLSGVNITSLHKWHEPNSSDADFNNPGWSVATASLEQGYGYSYYSPNSQSVSFEGSNLGQGTIELLKDAKIYYSGAKNLSKGQNLIGNPYPCGIRATSFLETNQFALSKKSIYLWDGLGSDGKYQSSDWRVVNMLGSPVTPSTGNGGAFNDILSPCQGFFVYIDALATKIVFNNDMREKADDINNKFFKSASKNYNSIQKFSLALINDKNVYSAILIGFTSKATNGFDELYDAEKIPGNNSLSFYSLMDDKRNKQYTIQGISELRPSKNRVVNLGYAVKTSGKYTIQKTQFENFFPGTIIYLEDSYVDTLINLLENNYEVQLANGKNNKRFRLIVITGNEPLLKSEQIGKEKTNETFINQDLSNSIEVPNVTISDESFDVYKINDIVQTEIVTDIKPLNFVNIYSYRNILTIESSLEGNNFVQITDLSGKIVESFIILPGKSICCLPENFYGIYFVSLKNKNFIHSEKIIVIK